MALAMAGCNDADSGSGGDPSRKFKEQVWTIGAEGVPVPFEDSVPLVDNTGGAGAGSIVEGMLTYSVEKPLQASLRPMNTFLTGINDKFKIFSDAEWDPNSPTPNAMELLFTNLSKSFTSSTDTSYIEETVRYIYVDRNCTLKAPSKANVSVSGVPVTVSALNLSLKEGWNTIKTHMEINKTDNDGTAKIEIGDISRCKWTLTVF
jgi:hypothetical protein